MACTAGIIKLQLPQSKTIATELSSEQYRQQEEAEGARLEVLKNLPAFGFDNLIADWSYIQFLLYFGDGKAREHTGYSLVPEYFEVLVENDPKFIKAYFPFSPATSIYAGRPEQTVNLLEKGIAVMSPEDELAYFLWMYKAIDELLFLGDSEAARNSYEKAAEWAKIANTEVSNTVAEQSQSTANFLKGNPNSIGARISSWGTVLAVAADEYTRDLAISKIKELGGEIIYSSNGSVSVKAPPEARE